MSHHSRLRRLVTLILLVYWGSLFIGTHSPSQVRLGAVLDDKLLHFGAYCGLSFLLAWVLAAMRPTWRLLLCAFAIAVSYGALDEVSQVPIPGRYGDLWDWLADSCGAALGILSYMVSWPIVKRWRQRQRARASGRAGLAADRAA